MRTIFRDCLHPPFVYVANKRNPHVFHLLKPCHGLLSALAKSHDSHAHNVNRSRAQTDNMLLPEWSCRGVCENGALHFFSVSDCKITYKKCIMLIFYVKINDLY